MSNRSNVAAVLLGIAMLARPLGAEELSDTAKKIIESSGDAIITVEIVSEMNFSYGGSSQTQEEKHETLATVVNANGTAVTALSSIDQTQIYERLKGGTESNDFSSTVKSIKYILADQTEIQATVAQRDADLDLAVLVPKDALAKPMTALPMPEVPTPGILDRCFTVARMGKIARRTVVAMSGEIQGVVTSPRTYYIPSAEIVSARTGVPVFNAKGDFMGIVLLHVLPGAMSSSSSNDEPVIPVVVPSSQLQETLKQIPADGKAAAEAPADASKPKE